MLFINLNSTAQRSTPSSPTNWSPNSVIPLLSSAEGAENCPKPHQYLTPSIEALQRKWCLRRASGIVTDCSRPNHRLFTLIPSGRRYRSFCSRTSWFRAPLPGDSPNTHTLSFPQGLILPHKSTRILHYSGLFNLHLYPTISSNCIYTVHTEPRPAYILFKYCRFCKSVFILMHYLFWTLYCFFLHFWLDANCISLSLYFYWAQWI